MGKETGKYALGLRAYNEGTEQKIERHLGSMA